jgi:hypothetical protein
MAYPYSSAVPSDEAFEKRADRSVPAFRTRCCNADCPGTIVKFGRCRQCLVRAFGPNWQQAELWFGDRVSRSMSQADIEIRVRKHRVRSRALDIIKARRASATSRSSNG